MSPAKRWALMEHVRVEVAWEVDRWGISKREERKG